MRSVELFAGAGGLAIGMHNAGFHHEIVLERDHNACATVRANQARGISEVRGWKVVEADARTFSYKNLRDIAVVSGGPPCQPFSIGGKHRGYRDERDMFPEAARAVRELRPKAFVFENVKGLTRRAFANYFQFITLQLTYPEIVRRSNENWPGHLSRLEKHHTAHARRSSSALSYNVVVELLNAADYGVPQKRQRVFFVGFRSDLEIQWSFPSATHSSDELLKQQWVTGDYWELHKIARRSRPKSPDRLRARIDRVRSSDTVKLAPWRTVRDGFIGLPDCERSSSHEFLNHQYIPGARSYVGHTGSPLDEPAKTLKAGDHGVPGGENMLLRSDGSVRYFTVREAARLQTFPDNYQFYGAWSEMMRQLGNAVPVALAETVAKSVAGAIAKSR